MVINMDEFYKHFAVPTTKPYSIEKKVHDFGYEWRIVNEKLTDTRRCLDIGGHIGIYAYEYSKIFDKVETFEPATKMFNLMNQNIHSIENISMHNVGISDKNGTELMYENPVNTESNVVVSNETKNIVGKAVIVHQEADDFFSQPSGAAGSRIICGGIVQ